MPLPVQQFLISLLVILTAAKIGSETAERARLPSVLGELIAGIVVGAGLFGPLSSHLTFLKPIVIHSADPTLILLGQLGLLSVWLAAAGAIFSFLLGFWSCRLLGLAPAVAAFVGASMTVTSLNPATSAGRGVLLLTVILTLAAFAAKIIAATTLPTRLNRLVIGCGMVPRGEVSLIFAAYGIRTHLLTANLYSAALLVIMLTTFLTPPAIKFAMKRLEDRTASKAAIRCPVDGEPDNCRTFLG